MKRYNPSEIEPKWQAVWARDKRYEATEDTSRRKYYVSGMFPYPSGAGMHIGHALEHAIVDAVARFQRAQGQNVLNPMGWDAFGLPAENYAIKTGTSPREVTKTNIANFTNQIKRLGASIDWSREINTSDPDYYKWTQWVFTQLYERGLAYQKEANQWWCPEDKTVLANEQVEGGKCWRCGSEVVKKSMKQWFFKITDYADALLDEIPTLDWPDKIKMAQTNWIGKSQGAEVIFQIPNTKYQLPIFTTRPDTLFGATFMVIAPEHELVGQLTTDETREAVEAYVAEAIKKTEIDRMSEDREKTGVFTGSYAINPATGENIPIWVADYVLGGYGTGAIMAVPAHDERDYVFARKFKLPVKSVIVQDFGEVLQEPVDVTGPVVIGYDPETKEFMSLINNKIGGLRWLVAGGREDGETYEHAARRELHEEAGFSEIKELIQLGEPINSYYYNPNKDSNRRSHSYIYLAILDRNAQSKQLLDQNEDYTVVWSGLDEIEADFKKADSGRDHWIEGIERARDATRAYESGKSYEPHIYSGEGSLVNSGVFDGMRSSEAREQIVAWLEEQGIGKATTTYKMHDWLISRQRYWGAPIPIVHCPEHGAVAVPEADLPVVLPEVDDYAPKGESVLASQTEWVNTACPTCQGPAERETDTMDGYTCSSWYLLRYTDPHNSEQAWNPENAKYWTPLDMYIGGDHAVAHLLYVRFWNHVFYDMGLVPAKEPVKKLVYHGLVGAEDGRKMSKSLGNIVDPLEIIDQGYGADALRTFELFLGPINENSQWNSRGIAGVYRFLNRVWTLTQEYTEHVSATSLEPTLSRAASRPSSVEHVSVADGDAGVARKGRIQAPSIDAELSVLQHRTIKKVTTDIHRMNFNTAIAGLMEYVKELYKLKTSGFSDAWREPIETLIQLLSIFAPHMTAELWQQLGHDDKLDFVDWPEWDEKLLVADMMTIVVQVGGKVRAKLEVAKDASDDDIKTAALAEENVRKFLSGKEPTKVIYVPGKLINIVD